MYLAISLTPCNLYHAHILTIVLLSSWIFVSLSSRIIQDVVRLFCIWVSFQYCVLPHWNNFSTSALVCSCSFVNIQLSWLSLHWNENVKKKNVTITEAQNVQMWKCKNNANFAVSKMNSNTRKVKRKGLGSIRFSSRLIRIGAHSCSNRIWKKNETTKRTITDYWKCLKSLLINIRTIEIWKRHLSHLC